MSYERITDPMYRVSCEHCDKGEFVDGEYEAHLSGYRAITISVQGVDSKETKWQSVIIWLCDECFLGFNNDLEPYIGNILHPNRKMFDESQERNENATEEPNK